MVSCQIQTLKRLTGFHSLPDLPREPLSTSWFRVFWYGWYGFPAYRRSEVPTPVFSELRFPVFLTTSRVAMGTDKHWKIPARLKDHEYDVVEGKDEEACLGGAVASGCRGPLLLLSRPDLRPPCPCCRSDPR